VPGDRDLGVLLGSGSGQIDEPVAVEVAGRQGRAEVLPPSRPPLAVRAAEDEETVPVAVSPPFAPRSTLTAPDSSTSLPSMWIDSPGTDCEVGMSVAVEVAGRK
jgi:hypothetical protein